MPFYGAILGGALVRLTCPHCKFVQVRSRKSPTEKITCKKCHKTFFLADASPQAAQVRDTRR